MRSFSLTEEASSDRRKKSEKVFFLTTEGSEEHPWGEFEPLRGTSWAVGIKTVPGDVMSHALHGDVQPLFRILGRPPHASGSKVPDAEAECKLKASCQTWNKGLCRPGGKGNKGVLGPPLCYEPPLADGTPPALQALFSKVAQAWKENRHTLVVVGTGFVLK